MSPLDQEKLFKQLRSIHPQWPILFLSGYIHGVNDEESRACPLDAQIQKASELDRYGLGYLLGFAMHRGIDAEMEPWYGLIALMVREDACVD
jgi:hypothetical protein